MLMFVLSKCLVFEFAYLTAFWGRPCILHRGSVQSADIATNVPVLCSSMYSLYYLLIQVGAPSLTLLSHV
jgi:hypothetical protein